MANELKPSSRNPFIQAADRIKKTGQPGDIVIARTRSTPKAPLNDIPDNDAMLGLVDKALLALSRGIRWARGSILNLLV